MIKDNFSYYNQKTRKIFTKKAQIRAFLVELLAWL